MKPLFFNPLTRISIGLAVVSLLATTNAIAQTQDETQPILRTDQIQNAQQIQEIDPRALEMVQQNQTLIQTIDTRLAANVQDDSTQQEYDRFGRPLAPINWVEVRESLSQQESLNAEINVTAARTYQPPPVPRNVETQELARPRLPMLMANVSGARTRSLREDSSEDGMLVFPRDNFYSSTMHINDLMIEVSGTRVMTGEVRDAMVARRMRQMRNADGVIITEMEAGLEVSFTRFGAAYNILITCENPEEMTECRDPETARAVYDRLTIMGGSPDGQADIIEGQE